MAQLKLGRAEQARMFVLLNEGLSYYRTQVNKLDHGPIRTAAEAELEKFEDLFNKLVRDAHGQPKD